MSPAHGIAVAGVAAIVVVATVADFEARPVVIQAADRRPVVVSQLDGVHGLRLLADEDRTDAA